MRSRRGSSSEEYAETLLGQAVPWSEGPSWRRVLAVLPKEQRAAALEKQAAAAADYYASEVDDYDDELVEY